MTRPYNKDLCGDFRTLLTAGFYTNDPDGVILEGPEHAQALAATKAWRNDLWKAFRKLEDRLCPVEAFVAGRDF